MKRYAMIAVVAAGCAPAASTVDTTTDVTARAVTSASATSVAEFTVAGIPVIFKPVRANEVVAVRLYLKGGSASLTPELAGIETFIAELGERGTQKYDREAFTRLATQTGTNIGGGASYDWSVFTAQGIRQHWDTTWDLFTQAVLHPTFPQSEVETVRGQLMNALRQERDDPDDFLDVLADSVIYTGHAYTLRPQGSTATVAAITRDQIADWHRRRLTKENLLLVVVGNVELADLRAKIAAAFAGLPATGAPATELRPLLPLTRDVLVVQRDLPTNYIAGYWGAPAPAEADFPAFRVATSLLSNRLFEEVRTKRNLTYAVAASLLSRRSNVGRLYVTAVQPDTTIRVMFTEVRRLQTEPVPADRLAERLSVLLTNFWVGQETNMSQAEQLGFFELAGGGWENLYTYPARLRAVTPADIQRVAQRYMRDLRFVVVGDPNKIPRELFTSM